MRPVPVLQRASRGFTLIEAMIVIALIGIVAAFAAPSFVSFTARANLKGAGSEAFSDLQFARAEAVQRNVRVKVTFNANGYVVARDSDDLVIRTVTLGSGNSVSSGADMVVVFDPVRATAAVTNGPAVLSNARASGTLRLSVNVMGRAELCSPGGTITGVAAC